MFQLHFVFPFFLQRINPFTHYFVLDCDNVKPNELWMWIFGKNLFSFLMNEFVGFRIIKWNHFFSQDSWSMPLNHWQLSDSLELVSACASLLPVREHRTSKIHECIHKYIRSRCGTVSSYSCVRVWICFCWFTRPVLLLSGQLLLVNISYCQLLVLAFVLANKTTAKQMMVQWIQLELKFYKILIENVIKKM